MTEQNKENSSATTNSEADKNKQKAKRFSGKTYFIMAMVIFMAMIPFAAPTMLVCLGLLPALVALITDTDPRKSTFITIGFLNLAGVSPFIVELWQKGQTMEAALGIISQPITWLVMFGTAGVGQLLLFAIPPLVSKLMINRSQVRLKNLQEGIGQLEAIWGPEVASVKPLELIRRQESL